jgi:alcohol dehydrogenase class IV
MQNFRHIVPSLRLYHGPDSLAMLPRELDRLGSSRAVIFCGSSLAREGKALDGIRAAMGDRCAGIYARVQAHSPLPAVEAAAAELERLGADAVIAVGGGSAVVTARAASILLAERGDARLLCTSRDEGGALRSPKLLAPKLPQIVIPTTPTTATLKAGSAVLDPVDGKRLALFDPKTRASAVFVHPDLLATPPRDLVSSAGLNTLAMALEGMMSRSGDPFSDALLMHATRLLAQHLPQSGRSDDLSMRADLMMASLICGHGTDYTGAGIAIPLGHAISARFHIDNGLANAVVLPHVVRFNAEAAQSGLEKLASAFGRSGATKPAQDVVIKALEAIFDAMDAPRRLRDIGVTRESLPELAAISMEDWFVRDNPRRVQNAGELQQVLENAW